MIPEIIACDGGVRLRVRARPGASRTAVAGPFGNALKITVQAPPEKGKANKELVRFLARLTGRPTRDVVLERGETSRDKSFRIDGMNEAELRAILEPFVSSENSSTPSSAPSFEKR